MASRLIRHLCDAKEKQKADSKTDSEGRAAEAKITTKVTEQITNEKILVGMTLIGEETPLSYTHGLSRNTSA